MVLIAILDNKSISKLTSFLKTSRASNVAAMDVAEMPVPHKRSQAALSPALRNTDPITILTIMTKQLIFIVRINEGSTADTHARQNATEVTNGSS